jgi:DASS family divalent anion:Na+ symporter
MAAAISTNAASRRWAAIGIAIAVGVIVRLLPSAGLSRTAHGILAVLAFTVVLWVTQAVNNGIASVLLVALLILTGVRPPAALSGYGSPPFWVLLTVLFYGFAMKKTGLAERASYYILSLFPATYAGILSAFFLIGFILALGIPSMTVRTAIMVPISWALTQSLGLPRQSRGSALIILTTVEMAVVPGLAFLYGSLSGPIVDAAFQTKHLPLSWTSYATYLAVPTLILCVLILIANQAVLRPEAPLAAKPGFASDRLRSLGRFRRAEMITAIVVVLSIVFWASDRYHHLPAFIPGMFAMAIFALGGILTDPEIATGVSWALLLFLGAIFGLANVIQEYRITDWLAQLIAPITVGLTSSIAGLSIAIALTMYTLRFIDPSSFIAISVLFLSTVDVTSGAHIPPLVLMAAILLASVPFWLPYQNFWVAMTEGLTAGDAFSSRQRLLIACTYALAVLLTLLISVPYWKFVSRP